MGGSCRYVLQLPLRPIGLRPAGPHGRYRGVGRGHMQAAAATPHRPKAGRAARALTRGGSKSHEGEITVREEHNGHMRKITDFKGF